MPVSNALVEVGGELQVIRPGFGADAITAVLTGHVIVIEAVHPEHPAVGKSAQPETEVGGGAFVAGVTADTALGKEQKVRGVEHRNQQVKVAAAGERETDAGMPVLVQPGFHPLAGDPGGDPCGGTAALSCGIITAEYLPQAGGGGFFRRGVVFPPRRLRGQGPRCCRPVRGCFPDGRGGRYG